MEKHRLPPPPRHRGGVAAQKPSFSSTLLDAIYRSIDDSDPRPRRSGGAQNPSPPCPLSISKHSAAAGAATAAAAATRNNKKPVLPHNHDHRHRRRVFNSTTSSSSDCSNDDFSSSEAEPVILRPIQTVAAGSMGRRAPDLTPAKTPASPGAKLASFLNSLFTKKKSVEYTHPCSTARSCLSKTSSSRERPAATGRKARDTDDLPARSCLSKTGSSRERMQAGADRKRSVRFDPVSVIVDKNCQRGIIDGRPLAMATAPERRRGMKGRVEEMRRGYEEGWESDSSSDLFELENLVGISGGGGGGKYSDELPVYKSTKLGRSGRRQPLG